MSLQAISKNVGAFQNLVAGFANVESSLFEDVRLDGDRIHLGRTRRQLSTRPM